MGEPPRAPLEPQVLADDRPLCASLYVAGKVALAGNLLIVGSIAKIIVVDQAAALGVRIGWREHARVGIPVTLAALALAAAWLAFRAA